MKGEDAFSAYHPLTAMLYFTFVIVFTMIFMHPICMLISFICAFLYAIKLNGKKTIRFTATVILPIMIVTALFNPLFSHRGVTVLVYFPNGNPLTLEAIAYGLTAALMLAAVISWFTCYNKIMTSDKFVYLFGKIIPSLSLVLSMALRFIPRFQSKIKEVANAQKCIGRDVSSGNIFKRAKHGMHILSVTVTWALENSIETADSMKSRGYGLSGRTSFSIYRFDSRNKYALAFLILCSVYIIAGAALGGLKFNFYPEINTELTLFSVSIFAAYALMCSMPLIINFKEELKWKRTQMIHH